MYFLDITSNPARIQKIVPFEPWRVPAMGPIAWDVYRSVSSDVECHGLHDPYGRTLVRRRRVGARGGHELVAGNVLVGEGDDPRSETVGASHERARRIAGAEDQFVGSRRREVAAAGAATVPAAEAVVSRGFTGSRPQYSATRTSGYGTAPEN